MFPLLFGLVRQNIMRLDINKTSFSVEHKEKTLLVHTPESPAFFVGTGEANYDMYRGNFDISDYLITRYPLVHFSIKKETEDEIILSLEPDTPYSLTITLSVTTEGRLKMALDSDKADINRLWIRLPASEDEKVYGCGEQLSYFNLRGKNFPLWSSEPGVGRNKNTYTTWQADTKDKAGGDYYTTNYPQPTFVSSDKYFCHVQTTAYADFDFTHTGFHELQCWEVPEYLLFDVAATYVDLVGNIADLFGHQPELPDWVLDGVILGIQGGTEAVLAKAAAAKKAGVKVSAVWCQDWQGIKITSFGKRLQWDWQWNKDLYPHLDSKIHELKKEGLRFLGYINPYVLQDFPLFNEAKEKGLLAKTSDGSDYLVDFGEFYCGVVDFTNPEACEWYKQIIKTNLIDFGLDGWMADFGEYLPTDCVLYNQKPAEIEHNDWPRRWAKINHEAIDEAGKTQDILFFMRAGAAGIQGYCHALWAGDQSVDWPVDDGLASVIPAALSAGMMGNGISHSDIGGYTTLHGMKRSKELLMRWVDMAAFTPIMRTHEGNRPDDNHQFDSDAETLSHFARMTSVFTHLKPYLKAVIKENSLNGLPVQRPLFMHYEEDPLAYDIKYQYLLGRDMMVAPVYNQGVDNWALYLPDDEWIYAWDGSSKKGGYVTVPAPIGKPPVFYRKQSSFKDLFDALREI